jgi:hypothetical protein
MIVDWLKNPFRQKTEDSLQRRAEQSRFKVNDSDEDITDQTEEKLIEGHRKLTFTLDKVIKDLKKNDG